MNEASNFCNGDCHRDSDMIGYTVANKLPYTPTGKRLDFKAISLDAVHADGSTELDSHSYFGSLQVKASNMWFKSRNQRTMIISRSNFAGMGKYGSIWLGDNHATVDDMEISVIASMKMNMFGITLNGADICGFGGDNTTAQLCTRWH
jgi:alpha-glucosidase (family GH31 glycosyl hydrolase)